MNTASFVRAAPRAAPSALPALPRNNTDQRADTPLLGQVLVANRALLPGDLVKALAIQGREEARLGEILCAHKMINPSDLQDALHQQWGRPGQITQSPPDQSLMQSYGAYLCLRQQVMPWQRAGGVVVVATARPDLFERHRAALTSCFGPVALTYLDEETLLAAIEAYGRPVLTRRAETRVPAPLSCRVWRSPSQVIWVWPVLAATLVATLLAPLAIMALLTLWAVFTMVLGTGLKCAAALIALKDQVRGGVARFQSHRGESPTIARLPTVSVMVPLFKETQIAARLVKRLAKQTYPKELLEVCLVVEEEDGTTRDALANSRLPAWMRVVTVPSGSIQTKPRALNYAAALCRGSIIGVWDAEDAPAPDQVFRIVQRFHARGPEVACLQGVLDFYNAHSSWMTRCFAIEYAGWFRVMLPGLARMGFAVPLGGTTLFFRRDALEKLQGWDAHNVTEDADLGIRLARHGYRTELIDTVTLEEANGKPISWIKQRSRWLKGYAMTWSVHMRNPAALMADLGPRKFWGMQVLFLGTLSQFTLAPLLWSFWILLIGLPHPLAPYMPGWLFWGMIGLFLLAEATSTLVSYLAVRETQHQKLKRWIPSAYFYFPLGALACYKALCELVTKPFYWDKTAHGIDDDYDL